MFHFPFLALQELELIVHFLYNGEISYFDQNVVYQVSKYLVELFGFPILEKESNVQFRFQEASLESNSKKRSRKQSMNPSLIRKEIKQEVDFVDAKNYVEEMVSFKIYQIYIILF